MVTARLKRGAEARQELERAEAILASQLPKRDADLRYPAHWQEWVHCEILHHEAETEVSALDAPAKPSAP
jgi:hypothetical protein